MPIMKDGTFCMNPQVARSIEESGQPSIATELRKPKMKNLIKKNWADTSDASVLPMIPERNLND